MKRAVGAKTLGPVGLAGSQLLTGRGKGGVGQAGAQIGENLLVTRPVHGQKGQPHGAAQLAGRAQQGDGPFWPV